MKKPEQDSSSNKPPSSGYGAIIAHRHSRRVG